MNHHIQTPSRPLQGLTKLKALPSLHPTPRIVVATSNIFGAGTDADVRCTVHGTAGDTGPRLLDGSGNDFERGAMNEFFFRTASVGAIQRLTVASSGAGLGTAWHLARIEVTDTATGIWRGDNGF